jgi:hypothetical protein
VEIEDVDLATLPPAPRTLGSDVETDILVEVEIDLNQPEPSEAVTAAAPNAAFTLDDRPKDGEGESEERLVAAQPVADLPFESAVPAGDSGVRPEPVAEDVVAIAVHPAPSPDIDRSQAPESPDGAEIDPGDGPASSRRPLAPASQEQLSALAFGAGEAPPPRHAAPPESGRLPALPVEELDADVTGVRPAPVAVSAGTPARAHGPVVMSPLRSNDEAVADVVGQPHSLATETFVAWLEATLAL